MTDRSQNRWFLGLIVLLPLAVTFQAHADSEFVAKPTWQPVAPEAVYQQLDSYLNSSSLSPSRQEEVRELWRSAGTEASVTEADVLERLAQCLAKADDRVLVLVDFSSNMSRRAGLPEFAWLADSALPPLLRHNLRIYLARALVQQGYYDEALTWTDGLAPADVVAPDALLFYRAVAHHQLVQPDKADAALGQLLQRQEELPLRFQKIAELMQQDVAGLEDESLDHIARRMADVRRRLAQGRAGQRVQEVEQGVVESLDKLIKEVEDQMQQQAQASASSQGGQQAQSPMQDSRLAPMKAPGNVDRRDIGRGTGWGNLPDKDREKALQEIGHEFPSHYREVIEEYFRRLAAEESAETP